MITGAWSYSLMLQMIDSVLGSNKNTTVGVELYLTGTS